MTTNSAMRALFCLMWIPFILIPAPLPAFILLALGTLLVGLPSKKEVFAGLVASIIGGVLLVLAAKISEENRDQFKVFAIVFVMPSMALAFHLLLRASNKSPGK